MARPNHKPRRVRQRGGKRHPSAIELLLTKGLGKWTRFVPMTDDQLLRMDLPLFTTLQAIIDGQGDDQMFHDIIAALLVLILCAPVMAEHKEIEKAAYNALDHLGFAHTAWVNEKRLEKQRLEKVRPAISLFSDVIHNLSDRRDFILAAHRYAQDHVTEVLENLYEGKRPTISVRGFS